MHPTYFDIVEEIAKKHQISVRHSYASTLPNLPEDYETNAFLIAKKYLACLRNNFHYAINMKH